MKNVLGLIISTFQSTDDMASPSFHMRIYILEIMALVPSYLVMLDLECDACIWDIFPRCPIPIKDWHPPFNSLANNVYAYWYSLGN